MKPVLTALAIVLTLAAPAQAFSITMDSLTPTLTYPEPTPQPVTQDTTGINE